MVEKREIFYFQFSQICGSIIFHIVVRSGQICLLWCVSIYSSPNSPDGSTPEVIPPLSRDGSVITPIRRGDQASRTVVNDDVKDRHWQMSNITGCFGSHPVNMFTNMIWLPPFPSLGRWTNRGGSLFIEDQVFPNDWWLWCHHDFVNN